MTTKTSIVIYSKEHCPYCVRAKQLLEAKGFSYHEIRVDLDEKALQEMLTRSQRRTVPQIFINNQPIGGYDDLYALDQSGKLDKLRFQKGDEKS
ncbi:MAG: glutaredoxin 3 [Gammaproteobacteria bacterium RIFCSPHIGHO2_12_FULL_40_19]|nr:MAG: glutaredoxin 3 [Gammaproteobacteria bacterium RIFCSPHIGHO2_12_FULL_40_19]